MIANKVNAFISEKSEGTEIFLLMLQDNCVMEFNLEDYYFKILQPELLPFSLRNQIKDSNKSNSFEIIRTLDLVRSFFSKRVLSLSRDNAKLLYGLFGINQANTIKDRVQACLGCHAVSVGDSYWVKRNTEVLAWKSVNIRINNLSSIIDISLDGQFPSLTTDPEHPDLTTDGLFRKSWIRRDGRLFLIKSDRTNEFINTKMEVLASEILDCFTGVEHIKYWGEERKTVQGNTIYTCVCENYCTEELSTVHASEVMEYCKFLGLDFKHWTLGSFGQKFANIATLDYVLLNTDRHPDNYGFYFDNHTGEIVSLLPLYDHNLALIADLAGTAEAAANSLSQMFQERTTLKQLALEMSPYSKLILDAEKFNRLRKNYPEYEKVFSGVLSRLTLLT